MDILTFFRENTDLKEWKKFGNEIYFSKPGQKTGSIAVNPSKNYFFDHSDGVGGGYKKAYSLYYNNSVLNTNVSPSITDVVSKSTFEIISISKVKHQALKNFITEERKLNPLYLSFFKEIVYTDNGKKYFTLGWKNVNGGYNTQNLYFKRVLGSQGVTYIKNNKSLLKLNCFESYTDYIAYLTHTNLVDFDALILNSTSMYKFEFDISFYENIDLYFDLDKAGDNCTSYFLENYPQASDKRFYIGFEDYNHFIKESTNAFGNHSDV